VKAAKEVKELTVIDGKRGQVSHSENLLIMYHVTICPWFFVISFFVCLFVKVVNHYIQCSVQ